MKYLTIFIFSIQIQAMTIVRCNYVYENFMYYYDLLNLVLKKTQNKYGPYKIVPLKKEVPQGRMLSLLEDNKKVDLVWTMSDKNREKAVSPIRYPLIKGLIGHRILLLKEKNKELLKDIKLSDLKKIKLGQGHDWPDTKILLDNGFNIVTFPIYSTSHKLLERERFMAYPRGANEAYQELDKFPNLSLIADNYILLKYPAPMYFFVSKSNKVLKERLEFGFEEMLKDGSFKHFFLNHRNIQKLLKKSNLSKRRVINLKNPYLSDKTPLNRKELWYPN